MQQRRGDVDSRGRWKRQRVVDRYIDLALPYPDAKAAAALCVGGPCKYVLKAGSCVTVQCWLCEYVVPNIVRSHRFQPQVAVVLALPILWACFADGMETSMPPELQNRIRTAYAEIWQLPPDENPVKKVLLVVSGVDSEVHIDEIGDMDNDGGERNGNYGHQEGRNNLDANVIRACYSQITSLRNEVQELRDEMQHEHVRSREGESRHFSLLNSSIQLAFLPARRITARITNKVETEIGYATLSRNTKNLYLLWQEYEFGLDGRKAAKLFTSSERGKVKHSYYRRKVFWDQISFMVRLGYTAQTAIDKVYQNYGPSKSVTWILSKMLHDRRAGELIII